jgi:hypothetical protein
MSFNSVERPALSQRSQNVAKREFLAKILDQHFQQKYDEAMHKHEVDHKTQANIARSSLHNLELL